MIAGVRVGLLCPLSSIASWLSKNRPLADDRRSVRAIISSHHQSLAQYACLYLLQRGGLAGRASGVAVGLCHCSRRPSFDTAQSTRFSFDLFGAYRQPSYARGLRLLLADEGNCDVRKSPAACAPRMGRALELINLFGAQYRHRGIRPYQLDDQPHRAGESHLRIV